VSLFLLDTDHRTLYRMGHAQLLQNVARRLTHQLAISVITAEEQRMGWQTAPRQAKDEARRERICLRMAQTVKALGIDRQRDSGQNRAKLGRYHVTLAHEVGHWRLHRHLFRRRANQLAVPGRCGPVGIHLPVEDTPSVGYQVNRIAACLLMPQEMINCALSGSTPTTGGTFCGPGPPSHSPDDSFANSEDDDDFLHMAGLFRT
jgi:hypothetical protein